MKRTIQDVVVKKISNSGVKVRDLVVSKLTETEVKRRVDLIVEAIGEQEKLEEEIRVLLLELDSKAKLIDNALSKNDEASYKALELKKSQEQS